MSCDARGRLDALALTGGHAHDGPQAPGLRRGHLRPGQAVLADRAHDAGYVRARIQRAGTTAVIPSQKTRATPAAYDHRPVQRAQPHRAGHQRLKTLSGPGHALR